MFIVAWADTATGPDRWVTFENEIDAKQKYFLLVERGVYTVSLCSVLKSTDYSVPLFDWVKKLGQWHLLEPYETVTRCGKPLLGNNYDRVIPESDRFKCPECWGGSYGRPTGRGGE